MVNEKENQLGAPSEMLCEPSTAVLQREFQVFVSGVEPVSETYSHHQ